MYCPQCGDSLRIEHGVYVCKKTVINDHHHYSRWGSVEQLIVNPYLLRIRTHASFSGMTINIYDYNRLFQNYDLVNLSIKPLASFKSSSFDMANEFTPEFIENMIMLA